MYYAVSLANIEKALISEDINLVYHIIGLTGRNASGKGTVASFLKNSSFVYHSLSDTLREELKNRKLEESRDNLIMIGNSLREDGGPGILADLMISNITSLENHVVDSIRNPLEVKSLRREYDNHNFSLISVDAKPEIRYERLKQRNRSGDSASWEEFQAQEKLEESSSNPNKQQLFATINKADYHIDNSGSLSDLENKISKILDSL